jgi:muramoyltetrapeptide carboxypeptidase
LIGFSDITLLHLWLNQRLGWPSLHAPTLLRAAKGEVEPESLALLKGWLLGTSKELRYALTPLNGAARSVESLTAPVLGGNLAVLTSALATPWFSSLSDTILFLEEIDERGYRIDRMLTQLQQAGALEGVLAIVLGDFSGGEEKDGSSLVWPVLERFANSLITPVFHLKGIGHERVNNPLPLNVLATLAQNQLSIAAPRA